MAAFAPLLRRAIGASYLLDCSPGAERYGGLEVVLTLPENDSPGRIHVEETLWPDGTDGEVAPYSDDAVAGVRAYAEKHKLDLSGIDVRLRRFVIHDVNSHPKAYFAAARNAMHAAVNMWHGRHA